MQVHHLRQMVSGVLVATGLFVSFVVSSWAAPFGYSVRGDEDTILYKIDLDTGVATKIGSGVGINDVEGLAFDPTSGILYGADDDFGQLITIDITTGVGTPVGSFGFGQGVGFGLAIDNAGNIFLYNDSSVELYSVNKNTGAATKIGPTNARVDGLAFLGSILYGVDPDAGALYTVNTITGLATLVGPLGVSFETQSGLAADGTHLWGLDQGGVIIRIDPMTGAAIQTASTIEGFEDLAIQQTQQGSPPGIVAAVLPSSRSVQVNTTATVFGVMVNSGSTSATGCGINPITPLPASFSYQTSDPTTNSPTGSPNTPVDIPAGGSQTFIISVTPTAEIPPTDVQLSFDCANTVQAASTVGLNTLLLSASTTPIPDIVALVATPTNDGIVHLPGATGGIGSTGVFAVASLNVGATGTLTVSGDAGGVNLPINITICQTNTSTGVCLAAPAQSVTTVIQANTTPSFGVFVEGIGPVPFNPGINRIFIRFKEGGTTRGSTSVAVQTSF